MKMPGLKRGKAVMQKQQKFYISQQPREEWKNGHRADQKGSQDERTCELSL